MNKDHTKRQFLKRVIVTGVGSVTFVKAASATAEPALPAIISLLLEDDNSPIDSEEFSFSAQPQALEIPADANFMLVDAQGAGGGGSDAIAFNSGSAGSDQFAAGASGGAGGRAQAVFDLRDGSALDSLGGAPVVTVGNGGGAANEFSIFGGEGTGGLPGKFGGARGGATNLPNSTNQPAGATPGGGGGGSAAITVDGRPIILAGGGGGAGGGVGGDLGPSSVKVGGKGGDAGRFGDANKRAGEDGASNNSSVALGGNRQFGEDSLISFANSIGGASPQAGFSGFAGNPDGDGFAGGDGGSTIGNDGDESANNTGGAGGAGGAGFGPQGQVGAGGGGGGGLDSGGGGGAAGANFVDSEIAIAGFDDDAGVGGAGGRGGLAGEAAESSETDLAAEGGAPAKLTVTFFKNRPTVS